MKPELDKKLCDDFPIIYRDRNGSMYETCMIWGFPGSGWFNLIYDLSKKLELIAAAEPLPLKQNAFKKKLYPHVENFSYLLREKRSIFWVNKSALPKTKIQKAKAWFTDHKYGKYVPGWYWRKVYDYFVPPEDNRLKATQVKEKFGTLRFYTNISSPEIDKAIREAEALSAITCEVCGEPGCTRGEGWSVTMCDICYKKYEERKKIG